MVICIQPASGHVTLRPETELLSVLFVQDVVASWWWSRFTVGWWHGHDCAVAVQGGKKILPGTRTDSVESGAAVEAAS